MIFDKVISQYDEHNEAILFLMDKFPIKEIIFIIDKSQQGKINEYKNNCNMGFKNIEVIFEVIEENINTIDSLINKYDKAIINLSGGKRIVSLILLQLGIRAGLQSIYVDFANKRRYVFRDECTVINSKLKDSSLEEVLYLSGADIVNESTFLCDKKEIVDISKIILSNLNLWHKYKQRLYDNSVFKHDYKETSNIQIDTDKLSVSEIDLLKKGLSYLKSINEIDEFKNDKLLDIKFRNSYLKSFLFKSGTWLEVITYMAVKNIKEVDEAKCGVLFSWGINLKSIKNEIDVIAIKDSVLICISCKDSNKYDEDALNELSVYSERLGGKDAVKILVAAKEPEKVTVIQRAKEMNINLVVLEDKDFVYLQKSLNNIINTNIK